METLVMPMNYVELQEDEMMYLDRGFNGDIFIKNIEGLGARGGGLAIVAAGIKKIFPTAYIVSTKGFLAVSGAVAPYIAKIGAIMGGPVGVAVGVLGTGSAVWLLGTTRLFY